MKKPDAPPPDLGELPPDYVDEDAIIAAEQGPLTPFASCTALMSSLYRWVVPNRWPKS
jgi:hypothetical protein